MQKIAMIGTGYVGLVSGTALADMGNHVFCVDVDRQKIEMLRNGTVPIYEPGLSELIRTNCAGGRLEFTDSTKQAVEQSDIIFIAVGTPEDADGSADLSYVMSAARDIARNMDGYKIIVDKSTVPIGTARKVRAAVREVLDARGVDYAFDVVSNPEFLREGSAVHDFTHPDRIVLGTESERALAAMKKVYDVIYKLETPFIETNPETAEMIKYASNAFLAVKISYINEIANLCEKVGANVAQVAIAMGKDGRISPKFLHPGPGYGGSCFPKDTKAIARIGREVGTPLAVVEAGIQANENQKHAMVRKIAGAMGDLRGKTLAILGVTFKPNTDDMREAPSLVILPELRKLGAGFRIYDPKAGKEAPKRMPEVWNDAYIANDVYEALEGADGVVIITDWSFYRNIDLERAARLMRDRYFFDLRDIYRRSDIEGAGFHYFGVGM